MKRLHVFRAGRRTAMSGATFDFSDADIAASAAAYDPELHEAPLVVGHPKTDAPAHGWVASLTADGSDLHAVPRAVEAAFAEDVQAERYKKISAAFYPPDHPSNPVPGVYYLRHVGFLGAQPPAVKGLKPVEFADDGSDLVVIEFGDWTDGAVGRALRQLREWFIGKFGLEEADKALPGWTADALIEAAATPIPTSETRLFAENPERSTMTPQEIAAERARLEKEKQAQQARDAEFAERETKLKARETAAAETESRAARADAVEFAEKLVKEGRVPSAQKNRVVELLHATRDAATELEFAEGDATVKALPQQALKDLLQALPVSIDFSERSRGNGADPVDTRDPVALAKAAAEFQEAEGAKGRVISIAQAMSHVTKQAGE